MLNPLFALSFQAARFGFEMQSIIALQLMRLMGGGTSARSEARRSVSEAMVILPEAQTTASTVSINKGKGSKAVTVSGVDKKRGHAKKRRLSK
jgi:hypothetical protein